MKEEQGGYRDCILRQETCIWLVELRRMGESDSFSMTNQESSGTGGGFANHFWFVLA